MSENKYNFKGTLGPWRIASKNKKDQFFVIHGKDTPEANREIQVVKIDYGYHPIQEQLDMTEANARLISASPELLEACIEVLTLREKALNTEDLFPVLQAIQNKIKPAVNKALNIID